MPAPAPEPVAAAVDPATLDFSGFMQQIGLKTQIKGADGLPLITPEYMAELTQKIATAFGVTLNVITDVIVLNDPRIVPWAVQVMQQDGRW
jgi:hypothetical protein